MRLDRTCGQCGIGAQTRMQAKRRRAGDDRGAGRAAPHVVYVDPTTWAAGGMVPLVPVWKVFVPDFSKGHPATLLRAAQENAFKEEQDLQERRVAATATTAAAAAATPDTVHGLNTIDPLIDPLIPFAVKPVRAVSTGGNKGSSAGGNKGRRDRLLKLTHRAPQEQQQLDDNNAEEEEEEEEEEESVVRERAETEEEGEKRRQRVGSRTRYLPSGGWEAEAEAARIGVSSPLSSCKAAPTNRGGGGVDRIRGVSFGADPAASSALKALKALKASKAAEKAAGRLAASEGRHAAHADGRATTNATPTTADTAADAVTNTKGDVTGDVAGGAADARRKSSTRPLSFSKKGGTSGGGGGGGSGGGGKAGKAVPPPSDLAGLIMRVRGETMAFWRTKEETLKASVATVSMDDFFREKELRVLEGKGLGVKAIFSDEEDGGGGAVAAPVVKVSLRERLFHTRARKEKKTRKKAAKRLQKADKNVAEM